MNTKKYLLQKSFLATIILSSFITNQNFAMKRPSDGSSDQPLSLGRRLEEPASRSTLELASLPHSDADSVRTYIKFILNPETNLQEAKLTTLHRAAAENNLKQVLYWLQQGASPNIHSSALLPHALQVTPLHLAIFHNNALMVQALLEAGAKPLRGNGMTPAEWLIRFGSPAFIEELST